MKLVRLVKQFLFGNRSFFTCAENVYGIRGTDDSEVRSPPGQIENEGRHGQRKRIFGVFLKTQRGADEWMQTNHENCHEAIQKRFLPYLLLREMKLGHHIGRKAAPLLIKNVFFV